MRSKPKYLTGSLVDNDDIAIVIENFNLNEFGFRYVTPLLILDNECVVLESKSDTTKKLIFCTDAGDFLLKEIPWYCDNASEIQFRHHFLYCLRRSEASVTELIQSRTGSTWLELGQKKFELQRLARGGTFQGSFKQIEAAGFALGELHKLSRPLYHVEASAPKMAAEITFEHIDLLEKVRAAEQPALMKAVLMFREITSQLEEELNNVSDLLPEAIAVHGDYSPWNAIFTDEGVSCIVDFDNACIDQPLHDLAEGTLTYAIIPYRDNSTNFQRFEAIYIEREKVLSFITGYLRSTKLSSSEIGVFPVYLKLTWIELACLGLNRGDFEITDISKLIQTLDAIGNENWHVIFQAAEEKCLLS